MQKEKFYYPVRFPVSTIQNVLDFLLKQESKKQLKCLTAKIGIANEEWNYDTFEEFFAEYPNASTFFLMVASNELKIGIDIQCSSFARVYIRVRSDTRKAIEPIFQFFENDFDKSKIVIEKDPVKIFIGHSSNEQWRLLKDHLHDHHGFDVIAYEIGPRAGLSVKEVLEEMLNKSSIAFLILTGEDEKNYGEIHARQNVVHELGLFQGRLGFKRAIALLEEGVTEFSNIYGVNQIRFSKGNIRETFGDVVAVIKREFE